MSEHQAGGWALTPTEFPHAGRLPIPEADREEDTLIVPGLPATTAQEPSLQYRKTPATRHRYLP